MKYEIITFTAEDETKRLDRALAEKLPHYSRSTLRRWIEEGYLFQFPLPGQREVFSQELLANLSEAGQSHELDTVSILEELQHYSHQLRQPSQKIPPGVLLLIVPRPKPLAKAFPENLPLEILYEDEDQLLLNKAAGMVVHAGHLQESGTLVNALLYHTTELSEGSEPYRPGIVHRLDKETSGVILVAKNNQAHARLAAQFAQRSIKKSYLAIVEGKQLPSQGKIDTPLGRHSQQRFKMGVRQPPHGRSALTLYKVLNYKKPYSLVACYPHTGRMHQIRVHLSLLGATIVGDPLYGERGEWGRHFLHAWKLHWEHPRTGQPLTIEAPLPSEFWMKPADAF